MKISNVDIIPTFAPLAKRYDHRKVDLYGIDCRIVYRVETDKFVEDKLQFAKRGRVNGHGNFNGSGW